GLARGLRGSAEPTWRMGSGSLPDQLEALRTMMGLWVAEGRPELAAATGLPLFQRLPVPERFLWTGLSLRGTDAARRGRELVETAARVHGYGRATLVLAAWDAEEGRHQSVLDRLTGSTAAADPKSRVLLAWAQARGGREDEAVQTLEDLAAAGRHEAGHPLGLLRMRKAVALWAAGSRDEGLRAAERAVGELFAAAELVPSSLRTEALLVSAGASAFAGQRVPPGSALLPSNEDVPWAAWTLAMGAVVEDPVNADPALHERLVGLVERVEPAPVRAVTALAGVLAHGCLVAGEPGRALALAGLLGRLAALAERTEAASDVRGLHGLAMTACLPHLPDGDLIDLPSPHDVPGVSLTLATALRALHRGDAGQAARLLREAPASADTEHAMCRILADTLDGRPATDPPEGLSPELTTGLRMAQAASLLQADAKRCLEIVTAELHGSAAGTVGALVDLERVLPALCAVPKRGARDRSASPLIGLVERLAEGSDTRLSPFTLARCATAVGAYATAERLWVRVLTEQDVPDGAREQFVRFLCHRAQLARADGAVRDAAALLRQAARVREGGLPLEAR
ncbi:MAG: hypothetical protein ACRDNL_29055, partial [Spirillospora sp.]